MPSLSGDNTVNVQINTKADLAGIEKTEAGMQTLGKQTEETAAKSTNWGKEIKTAGLLAGAGLAAVVKIGGDMVKSFNDSAQYGAQLDAVLRSTGGAAGITRDAAVGLSKEIEHNTALGDEAVLSGENMLLTFTNIGKDIFPQVTKSVVDMATAMNGGAIPSAEQMRQQAILVGKALQDPDAGLGALHRVGVNVDELKKKFTASMPIQEKQRLIIQELGKEFGGSAAASLTTYAGKQAHLKEQIDDVKESFGKIIVNGMTPFQGALTKLVPWLQKASDYLATHKVIIIAIAGAIGGLLIGVLIAAAVAIGWIPMAITAAAVVIGAVIAVIIDKWKEWHKWIIAIGVVMALMFAPWLIAVALVIKYWGDIKRWGMDAVKGIENGWKDLKKTVHDVVTDVSDFVTGTFETVKNFFVRIWQDIGSAIRDAITQFTHHAIEDIGFFIGFVLTLPFKIIGAFIYLDIKLIELVYHTFITIYQTIFQWVSQAINFLLNVDWGGIFMRAVKGAGDAAVGIWQSIYNWVAHTVDWVSHINWGGIFSGIGNAIAGAASSIWGAIKGAFDRIAGLNWGSIMSGIGRNIGNDIINLLQGAINGALSGIPGHPKINLPHFATGVQNFGGGYAVVGEQGPEIAYLPPGSNVYPHGTTPPGAGAGKQTTINNYGDNHFHTAAAVQEYFKEMDRDTLLVNKGLSPARGIS